MIQKIIKEIKSEYKKNRFTTVAIGITVIISLLNYIKPSSTTGILQYLGFSALNFLYLTVIILLFWFIFIRKKRGWIIYH